MLTDADLDAIEAAPGDVTFRDVRDLVAEVRRISSQVRIAEDALSRIMGCACPLCGPSPLDLAHARTLADDALARMDGVE